jgi:hypothetical protein
VPKRNVGIPACFLPDDHLMKLRQHLTESAAVAETEGRHLRDPVAAPAAQVAEIAPVPPLSAG